MPDVAKPTHYVEWVQKDAAGQSYTYTGPHMPRPQAEAMAALKMKDGAVSVRLREVGAVP